MRMGDRAIRFEYAAAVLVALVAGAVVTRRPEMALPALSATSFVLALALLGNRAIAWFVTIGAVLPWFPMHEGLVGGSLVPAPGLPALIMLTAAGPYAWSLATRGAVLPPTRGHILLVGAVVLTWLLALDATGTDALETIATGGFLVGITTYVCARRFPWPEHWLLPAVVGMAILLGWGAAEFSADPAERVGSFTGYPILYGMLVVTLLPPAVVWLLARSRLLAGVLLAAGVIAVIASQTRSAWLALVVMLLLLVALLVRGRRARSVGMLILAVLGLAYAIVSTDALSKVISSRLAARDLATESVTHREYAYGYTIDRFKEQPLWGRGYAGALKEDIANRTGITAADNGFLSLAGDLGVLGLFLGLVPAAAAGSTLWRAWRHMNVPAAEISLALGLVGALVVTLFFDTFYWPQSAALMYAFTGVLLARRQMAREEPPRRDAPSGPAVRP
jgi:O-Antigen ligase